VAGGAGIVSPGLRRAGSGTAASLKQQVLLDAALTSLQGASDDDVCSGWQADAGSGALPWHTGGAAASALAALPECRELL
jgi:hypothetical protein